MTQPANRAWWIVLNPAAGGQLIGVLVTDQGDRVHSLMGPLEPPLVKELAGRAWQADPTVDVSVAHGWQQAPDGLEELYRAKRTPR